MTPLLLELRDQKQGFRPGEEIHGAAYWKLENPPRSVEVRLFWRTRGKSEVDLQVVNTVSFPNPKPEEARPFQFRLPEAPYSFSGKLVSLFWGLEMILQPGDQSTQLEFILSPTGQEIRLGENLSPQEKPNERRL